MGLFSGFFSKFYIGEQSHEEPEAGSAPQYTKLSSNLLNNMVWMQGRFDGCADFVCKEFSVCGRSAAMMEIDNMVDKVVATEAVLNPLAHAQTPPAFQNDTPALWGWLRDSVLSNVDQHEVFSYEEIISLMMLGYSAFVLDGMDRAIVFGIQGYSFRSIEEPSTDKSLRGARDGFVEPLHINMMLVRRRIQNPNLKFELYQVGSESKTSICISYIKGVAPEDIVTKVRRQARSIDLSTVLASGYIQDFFQGGTPALFPTVGTTERPDTFCGRLSEGRVGVIVDNTPVALTMPHLLVENFQNMDDYAVGPYYATFTRILKYIAFFFSMLLPALYVAVGSFHQALLPSQLLYTLAQAEESTPFPLVVEALLMQLIYEMVREAGLRLPSQFGFAISIVGALIIGQAAVSAGLIGAPMVIIVALTATCSLITPTLYEPGVILRFVFLALAGMQGMYGLALGIAFLAFQICSIKSFDVPYTAPIQPLSLYAMRDVVFRAPWSVLKKRKVAVQNLPGSNVDQTQG